MNSIWHKIFGTDPFMHISRAIMFAAALALTGCSGSTVVTITNRSSITLFNIVVSGSGFTNRVERIAPGAEQRLAVHPRGESGLRVAFDAAGQKIDSGEQGYFEAQGYRVSAVIGTNLSVFISSGL
jgi:hypothetical protein